MSNKKYSKKSTVPAKADDQQGRRDTKARKPFNSKQEAKNKEYASHAYNDMSWYTRNPLLLESACRIPFAYPCGGYMPAGTTFMSNGTTTRKYNENAVSAGVMALRYVPSIGNTDDGLSAPINIAAREMYAKVRKAYSGALVCDAPDLMLYMLSLDGVFSYIAYLKRVYRLLDIYSGTNKYVVHGLLHAMGFTTAAINELRTRKTELWGVINTFIADANKWSCPAQFDILNRHYWMNDNVYLDKVSSKAQMFIFIPQGFYKFGLDNDSKGQVTVNAPSEYTFDSLVTFGKDLLNTLSNSEDAYTINGYLSRAFEGVPNFRISELGINDKQEFVYSEEVLNQIHNATIIKLSNDVCTVKQNVANNCLVSSYTGQDVSTSDGLLRGSLELLDSTMEVPDAVNVVVGSRLHATVEAKATGNKIDYHVNSGTEIVTTATVYRISPPQVFDRAPFSAYTYEQNFIAISDNNTVSAVALVSQFDWAPMFMIGYWNATNKEVNSFDILGDVNNLTHVANVVMNNLHRMCIYSEFNAFGID